MISQMTKEHVEKHINEMYSKFSTERIINHVLQGWSFTGQSREDHNQDVRELTKLIEALRKEVPAPQ